MRLIFEEYLSLNGSAWSLGSAYVVDSSLAVITSREGALLTVCGDFYNCLALRHLNVERALWALTNKHNSVVLLALVDAFSSWHALTAELSVQPRVHAVFVWAVLSLWFSTSLGFALVVCYAVALWLRWLVDSGVFVERARPLYNNFLELQIFAWVYGGDNKVESVEELLCLLVLWPWCVFIIGSHLFSGADHSVMFGFAEWGLPIIYGLLLLTEHFWTFGVYIFVYLVGVRGRRSFVVNMFEDFVAMLIMVVRVLLQSIRGVIVGMFHFICREALLNMTRWWSSDFALNHQLGSVQSGDSLSLDLLAVLADFGLAAGSLVVVTAIMFLQLIFLIVSVWLFCKC